MRTSGYRVIRSTVVLAMHSRAIEEIRSADLDRVLARVAEVNFDLGRLEDPELEVLYAHFDEAFGARVKSEFEFLGRAGDVIVHDVREAICNLCGKGGSKDTGDNADHIRFEFKLSNSAGGKDVWCGSTCILNFGLKVRGAATSEEARDLLQKSMRSALRLWTVRKWQAEHPDHESIPTQYEEMRQLHVPGAYREGAATMLILGIQPVLAGFRGTLHGLKLAARHYQRHAYLPPKKSEAWAKAKETRRAANFGNEVLQAMRNLPTSAARLDLLLAVAGSHNPKEN